MRKWKNKDLISAVKNSGSVRQVLKKLSLVEAGGNYDQIKRYISTLKIDTSHFHGKGWRKNLSKPTIQPKSLKDILVINSSFQSHKLKLRLLREGLKTQSCEICGWCKKSIDGRIPIELDHINGDKRDNRLKNLRILCPNCHSLQETHRGRNIRLIRNGPVA